MRKKKRDFTRATFVISTSPKNAPARVSSLRFRRSVRVARPASPVLVWQPYEKTHRAFAKYLLQPIAKLTAHKSTLEPIVTDKRDRANARSFIFKSMSPRSTLLSRRSLNGSEQRQSSCVFDYLFISRSSQSCAFDNDARSRLIRETSENFRGDERVRRKRRARNIAVSREGLEKSRCSRATLPNKGLRAMPNLGSLLSDAPG